MLTTSKTLTTTFDGHFGTYWVTGYREPLNLTARFDLTCLIHKSGNLVPILENADWPTMWREMHVRMPHRYVEATMRSALPSVDSCR